MRRCSCTARRKTIAKAVRNIASLGLRTSLGANISAVHGNYAGTVQQRLDDLHAAFADPEVRLTSSTAAWPSKD